MYEVIILPEAETEFNNYIDYIYFSCDAPLTAVKHYNEILEHLYSLEKHAEIYQIEHSPSLQKYGHNVRRLNYKKMAIIYTVSDETVYIHRIMAASLI
jgi:plasmid stabilization system protein ParE